MTEVKTHWKKLVNPHYIGAYSLEPGQDLIVTIDKVVRETVQGPDGKKEECTVAYLKNQKPLILNNTNQKQITKLADSPYIEDWTGKSITLYVAKVKAFGELVEALRVRPTAPAAPALPALNDKHPNWSQAITALKAGNTTIEKIKKSFTLTAESEQLLNTLSKNE